VQKLPANPSHKLGKVQLHLDRSALSNWGFRIVDLP
jgi:hypothetical protein